MTGSKPESPLEIANFAAQTSLAVRDIWIANEVREGASYRVVGRTCGLSHTQVARIAKDLSTLHIVKFSGGAGSWAAARRVVERYGADSTILVTSNTNAEHRDWLTFVVESQRKLGARFVMLSNEGDIWDLAFEQKMIPSARTPVCSRMLKQIPSDKWLDEHCLPEHSILYYGFDWTEEHRLANMRKARTKWRHEAPLMWDPIADKDEILRELEADPDLKYPEAYRLGLPHNNCLTYGCFLGGQKYWLKLLEKVPEVYARSEAKEDKFRSEVGDYTILRDRRGGKIKPLSLKELRLRAAQGYNGNGANVPDIDLSIPSIDLSDASPDWGSCGCYDASPLSDA